MLVCSCDWVETLMGMVVEGKRGGREAFLSQEVLVSVTEHASAQIVLGLVRDRMLPL